MSKNKDIGGWLRRKGHRLHTWSRKWFILRDKSLMMFPKEGDIKCLDTIHLDNQVIVEPPLDLHDPKQGYFDIINGNDIISLCADTPEEKQTWLRALKRTLYAKRGGALFSQSLEEILFWEKSSGRRIPYIVDECVQYLYKYGLDVEGIFRLGGRLASIKEVIARFDQGEKIEFEKEETDVHVVASVLKAFLRDLPDSIIPCESYQKFMNIALRFMDAKNDNAKETCVADLTQAMDLIPDDNYVILKYVCNFLKKVSLHGDTNKMTMMNIGTIFGNNIIRHIDKENSQLLLCTADLGQNLVFMLLNYLPQVFVRELKEEEEEDKNRNVATADLLHLSDGQDVKTSSGPGEPHPHLCGDLAGLDLTSDRTSDGSLKLVEDYYSDSMNCDKSTARSDFAGNREMRTRKKTLHLSLKRRPKDETGSGGAEPFSGSSDLSNPPIPPRRNKLARNRPVSERNRPKGVHLSSGNDSLSPQSPKTEFYTPPQTPTSSDAIVQKKFPSADSLLLNSEQDSGESHSNKGGQEEPLPTYEELVAENRRLTEDIAVQKERYKKDVSALRSQHLSLNQKYENRIKSMEACCQNQKKELEMKLEQEKVNVAVAVDTTMRLKGELSKYQLKYGELPST